MKLFTPVKRVIALALGVLALGSVWRALRRREAPQLSEEVAALRRLAKTKRA